MGDTLAKAFAKGIKHLHPKKLNLPVNRLTKIGAPKIIEKLSPNLESLDISKNNIGYETASIISNFILTKSECLKILNLEESNLRNDGVSVICDSLQHNFTIEEMNLSNNNISDLGACSIGNMLKKCISLKKLLLHWNKIKKGFYIFDSITIDSSLKILDLSWNCLGKENNTESLATMFKYNNLIHLDLSYNGINENNCEKIAQGLSQNSTIIGMHIEGNSAYLDALGFIIPIQRSNLIFQPNMIPGIKGTDPIYIGNYFQESQVKPFSKCWICEGWSEVYFEYPIHSEPPVYIHFDFQNYEPLLITTNFWKMCPPGKVKYFISSNGNQIIDNKKGLKNENIDIQFKLYENDETLIQLNSKFVNEVNVTQGECINDHYEVLLKYCTPRKSHGTLMRGILERVRTPWSFPISLFKNYKNDNEDLINQCFEFDWNIINKPKLLKEDLEKCKQKLKQNYFLIRDLYKYFSAIGKTESSFAINWNTITDVLLNQIKLIDGEKLTVSTSDLLFKGIKGKKNPGISRKVPKTALMRFETLEIIYKLALIRYYDSNFVKNPVEAVDLLISNHLKDCKIYDCREFRKKRYWNEECDNVYKANISLFEYLYDNYGGSRVKPGEKFFMSIDEYIHLMSKANLINDEHTERDATLSFCLSMMTQVDEINSDRHLKMTFVEFLEAVARSSESLSLPPSDENPENWNIEKRKNQLLHDKINNILPYLLEICKVGFKAKYIFPKINTDTKLYIVTDKRYLRYR